VARSRDREPPVPKFFPQKKCGGGVFPGRLGPSAQVQRCCNGRADKSLSRDKQRLQKNRLLDDRHVGSGPSFDPLLLLFVFLLVLLGEVGFETLVAQKLRGELDHGPIKMGLVYIITCVFCDSIYQGTSKSRLTKLQTIPRLTANSLETFTEPSKIYLAVYHTVGETRTALCFRGKLVPFPPFFSTSRDISNQHMVSTGPRGQRVELDSEDSTASTRRDA
jgi:hypothetical protein